MATERPPAMTRSRRERRLPETKSFVLTSEFWVFALGVGAMLFAGYVLDDLRNSETWRFVAFIGIAYIVSRGIAKSGSRRAYEPEWTADRRDYERDVAEDWSQRRSEAMTSDVGSDVTPSA